MSEEDPKNMKNSSITTFYQKKYNLALVIPVYNESDIIEKVISDWLEIASNYDGILIVINDGSTDSTLQKLNTFKNDIIILDKKNSGHGPSVYVGYKYALKLNVKYIFQTDSDNQFTTSDFKKFWDSRNNFDLILGYRKIRYDAKHRLVITRLLRYFLRIFMKINILDSNIPYRLLNSTSLEEAIKVIDKNCIIPNISISIILYRKEKRIKNIEVTHMSRNTGKVSIANFRLVKFCIIALYTIIKIDK